MLKLFEDPVRVGAGCKPRRALRARALLAIERQRIQPHLFHLSALKLADPYHAIEPGWRESGEPGAYVFGIRQRTRVQVNRFESVRIQCLSHFHFEEQAPESVEDRLAFVNLDAMK